MNSPYGIIYKITNKINGMSYIGQTVRTLEKRWAYHQKKKSGCPLLCAAIQKYGKENFEIKIVCRANSQTELDHREILCIRLFKSKTPNGYNILIGGNGKDYLARQKMKKKGFKHSLESRLKMSESRKGRKPWNKGISTKPETIQLLKKIQSGKNNGMFGRHHTEESKRKIAATKKGRKNPQAAELGRKRSIPIICLDTGDIYPSTKEAARVLGIDSRYLNMAVNGKRKTCKGLRFSKLITER
jgi:group I intron endonuclease